MFMYRRRGIMWLFCLVTVSGRVSIGICHGCPTDRGLRLTEESMVSMTSRRPPYQPIMILPCSVYVVASSEIKVLEWLNSWHLSWLCRITSAEVGLVAEQCGLQCERNIAPHHHQVLVFLSLCIISEWMRSWKWILIFELKWILIFALWSPTGAF